MNVLAEPQTWYKIREYDDVNITPVVVTRYSEKTVTCREKWGLKGGFKERRANRHGSYENFYPTFDEAIRALIGRNDMKLKRAQETAEKALQALDYLATVTEPDINTAMP